MIFLRAALAAALLCTAMPALAAELTAQQAAESMNFAMHDATFTLYHEIGHLLVRELGLPVLGKEEDAADALAVILLLNDEDDEDEAFDTLIDSADGWYFNAMNTTGESLDDLSFYDEHSLDIQRAYAMVCMMVGADPEGFGATADEYEIDKERQAACAGTYQQAHDAWASLLSPHLVGDTPGAEITVVYEDAGDHALFADELKRREVLDKAARLVSSTYKLPTPVTFRAGLCGEANAFYSAGDNQLIYCYELAATMYALYAANAFETGVDGEEGGLDGLWPSEVEDGGDD